MSVASKVLIRHFGTPGAAVRALLALLSLIALFAVARRAARARADLRQRRRHRPRHCPRHCPPSPPPPSPAPLSPRPAAPPPPPRPVRRAAAARRRPGVWADRVLLRRLAQLLRLCVPRVASAEAALMCALAAMLALRTALTLTLARVVGRNSGALVAREGKALCFGVVDLAVYSIPVATITVGIQYIVDMLERRFRTRAQAALHAEYFRGLSLYNIALSGGVDNPAHRVTTDVQRFCSELADLLPALLKPLMNIGIFSLTLARLGGSAAPAAILSYYALAALIFRAAMPNFADLVAYSRNKEGNLRTMHTQLIQHAEEVAFYRGAEVEKGNANRLLSSFARIERYIKRVKWWTSLLNAVLMKHGATCMGYAACAITLRHAQGHLDAVGLTQLQMQSTQLYIPLSLAVGRLLSLHLKLGALCSSAHRIGELRDHLSALAQRANDAYDMRHELYDVHSTPNTERGTVVELASEDRVVLRDVAIVTPAMHVLLNSVNLDISAGHHLLVTGGNGAGKTALLLTIAGLWPLRFGVLARPPLHRLVFLTQRVYLPPGTLRAQLVYPMQDLKSTLYNDHHNNSHHNNNNNNNSHDETAAAPSDAELQRFAAAVGLAGVIEREGGLDAVKEWGEVLSGGERQRIALVRVLVQRPAFAFLDECTSAISQDAEPALYACLRRAGVTLVTVSHRKALRSECVEELHMDGMGGYTLEPGSPLLTEKRTEMSGEVAT